MKLVLLGLLLVAPCAFAQNGCGATLTWKSPLCQVISLGQLNPQWTVVSRHGEYGQSETECNKPSGVNVENGSLVITTSAVAATCGNFNADGTINNSPTSWPYSTGQVQWSKFSFTYGTVNFRVRYVASATNLWPSHWFLTTACQDSNKYSGDTGFDGCPNIGDSGYTEIDALECYNDGGYWCQFHVANPNFGIGGQCDDGRQMDTNWHTFSMVWTPSSIKIYQDGTLLDTCNQSMSNPMFMIILTQTGGVGGTPSNANLPASHYTSYVQVINQDGQTIFYDDFQAPVPKLMLRPLARYARLAGGVMTPGAAATGSVGAGNSVSSGANVRP
jgi:hypothetical protein